MRDKVIIYERFNQKAYELFSDLSTNFPNIAEFKKLKAGFLMISNMDVKLPEKVFKEYVSVKFRDYILTQNEEFFLQHDDYQVWSGTPNSSKSKDHWKDFINEIKAVWINLDKDNKDIIWKYFHILLILSDKCNTA